MRTPSRFHPPPSLSALLLASASVCVGTVGTAHADDVTAPTSVAPVVAAPAASPSPAPSVSSPPTSPPPATEAATPAAPDAAPAPVVVETPATPSLPPPPAPVDAPRAQDRQLVAVLDVKASAGTDALASALTTMLTAEVGASEGLRAVSRNELRALLAHQADAQLIGCDDVKCFSDVAKLASADLLVAGQIDRIDGAHVLALTLVDPTIPAIVARQEAVWRGSSEEMLALVRPLVARLVDAPHAAQHIGALEVVTTAGAHVIVDGKDVGLAPLPQPISALQSGVHTISLQKADHYTSTNDVVIARDETTIVRTQLQEVPLLAQPWFWAATGGVVVLAAGATAGVVIANQLNQDAPPKLVIGQ